MLVMIYGALLILNHTVKIIEDNYYNTLVMPVLGLEAIVFGASIFPSSVILTCKMLPERGYTLIMIFHWISLYSLNIPYIWFIDDSNYTDFISIYLILFIASSIFVYLKLLIVYFLLKEIHKRNLR